MMRARVCRDRKYPDKGNKEKEEKENRGRKICLFGLL
jgi:hypothetical protein